MRSSGATLAGEHAVYQTDLPVTLALLIGLPIPFSNLGAVLAELLVDPAVSTLAFALCISTASVDKALPFLAVSRQEQCLCLVFSLHPRL